LTKFAGKAKITEKRHRGKSMFSLNPSDKLMGSASITNKISFIISAFDGTSFSVSKDGLLSDSVNSILFTATKSLSIISILLTNTHTEPVLLSLQYEASLSSDPRYLIPKNLSLGPGSSIFFDGQKISVLDINGGILMSALVSEVNYSSGWSTGIGIAPSQAALYNVMPQTIMTAKGDILFASAANVTARLAIGSAGQKLKVHPTNGLPIWQDENASVISEEAYNADWSPVSGIAPSKAALFPSMPQTIMTEKGDILFASAANVLARLAIGTAGQKLSVNSAGDAPLWGVWHKIKSATRDNTAASGDVAYTGVGFKPLYCFALSSVIGSACSSVGTADVGVNCGSLAFYGSGVYTYSTITTNLIHSLTSTGNIQSCILKSYDADGFTLTWTKTGYPTGTSTFAIMCIG